MDDAGDCPKEGTAILDRPAIKSLFIIAYCFVFSICLLGNLFTIVVICAHRSMRTATNFFLANLALADLLVAIFCILQNMLHLVGSSGGHWPLGATMCKLYLMMIHLVPCMSIGILVCVSLEKYITVLHPFLARKLLTPNFRGAMMAAIWLLSLVFNMPYYFTTKHLEFPSGGAICIRNTDNKHMTQHLITASFFIWYCVPLVTMAFLYTKIGLVLWNGRPLKSGLSRSGNVRNRTNSSEEEMEPDNSTKQFPPPSNTKKTNALVQTSSGSIKVDIVESRKKIIRLLITIVFSFALLTLPNHIRLIYFAWSNSRYCTMKLEALFQPLAYLCLFLSSSCNPFLFAFMSQRFRDAVRDIFKCKTGIVRRKHIRTRTQNSDMPGYVMTEVTRCSSLNRLNLHNDNVNVSIDAASADIPDNITSHIWVHRDKPSLNINNDATNDTNKNRLHHPLV